MVNSQLLLFYKWRNTSFLRGIYIALQIQLISFFLLLGSFKALIFRCNALHNIEKSAFVDGAKVSQIMTIRYLFIPEYVTLKNESTI